MKATGIVRRVDDLGRIVIPKEIRRTLRIREGDPLEIYTEKDGGVIFRKYSPMGDLQEFAAQMCESIGSATGHIAAVADRDSIIALHGVPKRELIDKPNSPQLERLMEQRKNYLYQTGDTPIPAADGAEKYHLGAAAPILSQGDLMGCVMLLLGDILLGDEGQSLTIGGQVVLLGQGNHLLSQGLHFLGAGNSGLDLTIVQQVSDQTAQHSHTLVSGLTELPIARHLIHSFERSRLI